MLKMMAFVFTEPEMPHKRVLRSKRSEVSRDSTKNQEKSRGNQEKSRGNQEKSREIKSKSRANQEQIRRKSHRCVRVDVLPRLPEVRLLAPKLTQISSNDTVN